MTRTISIGHLLLMVFFVFVLQFFCLLLFKGDWRYFQMSRFIAVVFTFVIVFHGFEIKSPDAIDRNNDIANPVNLPSIVG